MLQGRTNNQIKIQVINLKSEQALMIPNIINWAENKHHQYKNFYLIYKLINKKIKLQIEIHNHWNRFKARLIYTTVVLYFKRFIKIVKMRSNYLIKSLVTPN